MQFLYKLLQATLSNPVFMRDGGVLGFNSHYSYVFDTQWADLLTPINTIEGKVGIIQRLNRAFPCNKFIHVHLSKDKQARVLYRYFEDAECNLILDALSSNFPLLKGADYIVVESAKSLGLPVCVKPFVSHEKHHEEDFNYVLKDFSQPFAKEEWIDRDDSHLHELDYLQVFGDAICRCKSQDITWCQELSFHQPAGAAVAYGNDASLEFWYKSAAILIKIPKWSESRQKLIAISTEGHCSIESGPSETGDDEMVKDFDDVIQDYEDIVQGETQQLLELVKKLLDNECINEVDGLVDMLKRMQMKLNSHATCVSEEVDNICTIKCDLRRLRDDVQADAPHNNKVSHLRHIMSMMRH